MPKYNYKDDAMTAYMKGKISAKELDKISKEDFKSSVATKQELQNFLKSGYMKELMANTYGLKVPAMEKKVKELMRFAESMQFEGMFSTIDQIRQDSKDVRDFVKNVFADRDFKKMKNDKDFIKYLKSVYEGFASDAQRRAAFASGYKAKGKKKESISDHPKASWKDKEDDSVNEILVIVDKFDKKKQSYGKIYYKDGGNRPNDGDLKKANKELEKLSKKHKGLTLVSVGRNSKMYDVHNPRESVNEATIKGQNRKTGETFGMVIGSDKKNKEGNFELTIRVSYSSRISAYKLTFNSNNELISFLDYGYSMDGRPPDMKGSGSGKSVKADKRKTIIFIAKLTSPAFANKIYKHLQKVNESVNEKRDPNLFYVLFQKKGVFGKPAAAGYKTRKDAEDFAKSLRNYNIMILNKQEMKHVKGIDIKEASMDWEKNFKWANDKELKVISKFIWMNPKGIDGVIKMSKHKPFAFQRTIQKMAKKGLHEGKKRYNVMYGVGSSKYTVNFHNGKSKHKDGSDFFDIAIFKNKKDLAKKINDLTKQGYIYSYQEGVNESKTKESKVVQMIYKYAPKEKKFYDKMAEHERRIGPRDFKMFIARALRGFGINPNKYKSIPDAEEKLYQTVSQ